MRRVMVARVIMARAITIRVTMVRVIVNLDTMVIGDMGVASPGRVWVVIPDIATATTVARGMAMTSLDTGPDIGGLRRLHTVMVHHHVLSPRPLLLAMKKLLLTM